MALLAERMDASDLVAARAMLGALLDLGEGLPARASEGEDGAVTLPLRTLVDDGAGDRRDAVTLRRLTGGDLMAIAESKDMLLTALSRAGGMSPKAASGLLDAMDGADVVGLQRIVGFLSGTGRMTGR